ILHCLDAASGKPLWDKPHDLLKEFGAPNLQWGTSSSPLLDGDRLFVNPGGPGNNSIAAFDKKTGALLWKALDDPAGYSSPIAMVVDGIRQIVFFTGTRLVGVKPEDGTLYWSYPWPTEFQVNAATPIWVRARKGNQELNYVFVSSGYAKGC